MSRNETGAACLPAQYQLDIVRDCADLNGQFPENVELKFVYWEHGEFDGKTGESNGTPYKKVSQQLLESDYVAMEVAEITFDVDDADGFMIRQFDILNEWVDGRRKADTIQELYGGGVVSSTAWIAATFATDVMETTGRRPPYFVPVDAYANPVKILNTDKDVELSIEDIILCVAEDRQREAVTVRQLHNYAHQLASDGKNHQIAVIYGTSHSHLSVGMRTLGAPVKRVVVGKIDNNPYAELARILRYTDDEVAITRELEIARGSLRDATNFTRLCKNLGTASVNGQLEEVYSPEFEWLFYRAAKNTLTPKDQKAFNEQLAVILPHLDSEKRPKRSKRKSSKKASLELINLAFKIWQWQKQLYTKIT